MPLLFLTRWLAALISTAVLIVAIYLLYSWLHGYDVRDAAGYLHHVRGPQWRLWVALGLFAWSFLGRFVILAFFPRTPREPDVKRTEGRHIAGADGSRLWVETYGEPGRPTLVMTHGWGLDSSAWSYLKPDLVRDYRLVLWDLPGLGRSKAPPDRRLTIERLAGDLRAVIEASGAEKVALVGHSIGGMTVQTFLRDHADFARERITGVVLLDTTYDNPLETMIASRLWLALQKPLIEPMCWMQIALSPLVHLMNWKSWLDGSAHLAARLGFGARAPRDGLEHVARLSAYNSPSVQAKGNLAMFRWSVEPSLARLPGSPTVVSGTSDIITLPQAGEHIARTVPGARLVTVSRAGHMGFMEQPARYLEAIRGGVKAVSASIPETTASGATW